MPSISGDSIVSEGRPGLSEQQVTELADGRVYTAKEALDKGLIDRIGTIREAIDSARRKGGAGKIKLVRYRRPVGYVANYHAATATGTADVNLINIDLPGLWQLTTPRFLYLCDPALPQKRPRCCCWRGPETDMMAIVGGRTGSPSAANAVFSQ